MPSQGMLLWLVMPRSQGMLLLRFYSSCQTCLYTTNAYVLCSSSITATSIAITGNTKSSLICLHTISFLLTVETFSWHLDSYWNIVLLLATEV